MHIPLLDLKAQYETYKDQAMQAIAEVCESQAFALTEIGYAMGKAGMYDRAYALFDKASELSYKKVTDAGLQAEILEKIDRYRGQLE